MLHRVVYNSADYFEFELEPATLARFNELSGKVHSQLWPHEVAEKVPRHDPNLIQAVVECESKDSELKVKALEGNKYRIVRHLDGAETVIEPKDMITI